MAGNPERPMNIGRNTTPKDNLVPTSKTESNQFGSMGSGSKTGNETKRKKPPSNISEATGK